MAAQLPEVIQNNLSFLLSGLNQYNNSYIYSYSSPHATIARINSSSLSYYGGKGAPILLVPSHINTSAILDFSERESLVLKLKNSGYNPYVLDWNKDSATEQLSFEDYLNLRLKPILEKLYAKEGRKIILVGHCMGGLFAICAAQFFPELIEGVATLATPWNFHAYNFLHYPLSKYYAHMMSYLPQYLPVIPKELIHLMLYIINFPIINQKYIELGKGVINQEKHIAIENWFNRGLDMSGALFSDCMDKFLINNKPYLNEWYVNNQLVQPHTLTQKTFCAIAKKDKVTPMTATVPLSVLLKRNTTQLVDSGHIGMIISSKNSIAEHLINWIKTNFK